MILVNKREIKLINDINKHQEKSERRIQMSVCAGDKWWPKGGLWPGQARHRCKCKCKIEMPPAAADRWMHLDRMLCSARAARGRKQDGFSVGRPGGGCQAVRLLYVVRDYALMDSASITGAMFRLLG